ncbi:MAG: hypothetical protein M3O70_21610 [Actinomycetota bacterium]|nr:hypothetical protein [Actinomycetota bacterium]
MARSITVEIVGDASKLNAALGSASQAAEGFGPKVERAGTAVRNTGAVMSAAITVPVAAAFASWSNAASDMAETVSKVGVVFGASAGKVEQFASTTTDAFGISKQAALDMMGTVGTMGTQLGLTTDQSFDLGKSFVTLAGDWGSFANRDPAEVFEMMMSATRGEYDSLQQLIPTINAAAVEEEALRQTGKKRGKDLTELEKIMATHTLIQKASAAATGDAARTHDSAANAARRNTAEYADLSAKIGDQLIPLKQKFHEVLSKVMAVFTALPGPVQGAVLVFAGLLAVLGPLLTVVGQMMIILPKLGPLFGGMGGHIASAAAASGRFVASTTAAFGRMIASAATASAQFAVHVAKIIAGWVAMAAQATWNAIKVAAAWLISHGAGLLTAIASMAVAVAATVGGWLAMAAQAVVSAAIIAAQWLIAFWPIALIIAAVVGLVALIVWKWDEIKAAIGAGWNWVKETTAAVWGAITGWLGAQWERIKALASSAWEGIKSGISGAWERIKQVVGDGISAVVNWFAGLPGRVVGAIGDLAERLVQIGRDLVGGIWRGIQAMGGWLVDQIKAWARRVIPGPIADILGISSPSKLMMRFGQETVRGFAVGLQQQAPELERIVQSVFGLVDSVLGFGGGVAGSVPSLRTRAAATARGAGGDIHLHGIFASSEQDLLAAVHKAQREYARHNGSASARTALGIR